MTREERNELKRLMKAKRRKGLKQYAHGFELVIPNIEKNEFTKLTFRGSFDRRQLRKMVNKALVQRLSVVQVDWLIDTFGTPLKPMTMDQMIAMVADDDA